MFKRVLGELREHVPFTFMGAVIGIFIVILLKNIPENVSFKLFYVFHPLHVFLSAFVTASMYKLSKKNPNILMIFLIGFVGSIGVATLSDSIIPFLGETILRLPQRELHLGFVEKWYVVDPIAFLGIFLAMKKPFTKLPHSWHVMLSTSASLLHIMMSLGTVALTLLLCSQIVIVLFFAVWAPCCFSDIIFPLLFIFDDKTTERTNGCH